MDVDELLTILRWGLPITVLGGSQVFERLALWRGYDGLTSFVERDGRLIHPAYASSLGQPLASWPVRVARQIKTDLTSVAAVFIAYIGLTIASGVSEHSNRLTMFGIALAAAYVWMFVTMLRQKVGLHDAPLFDATLVSLKGPSLLSIASATARADDGRTFTAGVAWRPIEASRRKGPVRLVFVGSPARATFVGLVK